MFAVQNAWAVTYSSANAPQLSLVELYTSEGCSSCPPADKKMSDFTRDKGLWDSFVPIAFHVDYWDRLGWKDKYANSSFADRQREYANLWQSKYTYTPGFVVSGLEWDRWRNQARPKKTSMNKGVLTATDIGPYEFNVSYDQPLEQGHSWKAHAVLMGFNYDSPIRAGENRGKKLRHDFVALDLKHKIMLKKNSYFEARFKLNVPPNLETDKYAVVFWIESSELQKPIQVTGGYYG
ncbi:MAG: hypothetical protein ACI9CF_001441 [Candidatus Omnitrophota bacterium]|jgi:hypothetical protein